MNEWIGPFAIAPPDPAALELALRFGAESAS